MFRPFSRSGSTALQPPAPGPATTNADTSTSAVRSAVHDLHSETDRRERYRWTRVLGQDAPTRSAVARIGLGTDVEEATSDLLVRILAQLRVATARYVVELRSEGAPPEEMLVRVKALTRTALNDDDWWDRDAARSLTAAMVVWSIDAYYGR